MNAKSTLTRTQQELNEINKEKMDVGSLDKKPVTPVNVHQQVISMQKQSAGEYWVEKFGRKQIGRGGMGVVLEYVSPSTFLYFCFFLDLPYQA